MASSAITSPIFGLEDRSQDDDGNPVELRIVHVRVCLAKNLAKKDVFGASDPYVKLTLYNHRAAPTFRDNEEGVLSTLQTETKKRTLNPRWMEDFYFRVDPNNCRLLFEVFDENRLTRDDFLGNVDVPLFALPEAVRRGHVRQKEYILRPRSTRSRVKGHLRLELSFLPRGSRPQPVFDPDDELNPTSEAPEEAGCPGGGGLAPLASTDNLEEGLDGGASGEENGTETPRAIPTTSQQGEAGWEMVEHDIPEAPAPIHRAPPLEAIALSEEDNQTNSSVDVESEVSSPNDTGIVRRMTLLLPPGWEERMDANGRTFYVNHLTRTTQWRHPSLALAPGTDATTLGDLAQRRFFERRHISVEDDLGSHVQEGLQISPPLSANSVSTTASEEDADFSSATDSSRTGPDGGNSSQSNGDADPEPSPGADAAADIDGNGGGGDGRMSDGGDDEEDRDEEVEESPVGSPAEAGVLAVEESPASVRSISVSPSSRHEHDTVDTSRDRGEDAPTPTPPRPPRPNRHNRRGSGRANRSGSHRSSERGSSRHHHHHHHPHGQPQPPQHLHHGTTIPGYHPHHHPQQQQQQQQQPRHNRTDNLEPLPPGWELQVAPNGRCFFIDHSTRTTSWVDPRTGFPTLTPRTGEEGSNASPHRDTLSPCSAGPCFTTRTSSNPDLLLNLGPLPPGWEERVHTDGRIFYIDHNTHGTTWEDPRLKDPRIAGPAVPYSREFKRKVDYFRSKLKRPQASELPNKFDIRVTRDNLMEDSYRQIISARPDYLKARLWIEFSGEVGLDYGGVAREWFFLLSKEMFNPYYGLFEYSATDNYTLQINPNSGLANHHHLRYFRFIGRVAGMAVYHGKLLDAFFIRPFYKMMLGKPITLKDMESVDSEYYNSLKWILENDPECLDLKFTVDEEGFGTINEAELKEGGADCPVTNANKLEYIALIIKWRFLGRVEKQMKAFMEGFTDVVHHNLIRIFDENELELLMCGLGDIDVNDWKKNTLYKSGYERDHPTIILFWRAVYSLNGELRARLLQFVTGTSRVPMNGFAELYGSNGPQKFTIEMWGTTDALPRAHTCFNRLDLPPYTSYDEIRRKVLTAIEFTEGFEGVD